MRRVWIGTIVLAAPAAGLVAVARGSVTALGPLPQSFCSPLARGSAEPQVLIVSDLPVRYFPNPKKTFQFRAAIKYVLEQRHYRAGKYPVGYQACDDSSPQQGAGAVAKCASNAKAYAQNPDLVGVVGTWFSGCSEVEIPILNRAHGGPVGLVSPTNTSVGLTHAGGGTQPGEPARYYPTGKRNFVRIISPDDAQAVGDALLAKQIGAKRVFVLDDGDGYGLNVAVAFRSTAVKLGLRIAGTGSWAADQSDFSTLVRRVKNARSDAVFLGGFACSHCGQLIRDLRGAIGAKGSILAGDGFTPPEDIAKAAGAASEGMYVSVPGLPFAKLPRAGQTIERRFGPPNLGSGGPSYAAQAAAVLLDAIAASDGTRASLTEHLLTARVRNGFIGSFSFDRNGDPTFNPTMIFRVSHGKGKLDRVVTPPPNLIP